MSTDIDKNIKNEYTLPIASNLLMLSNQIETNDKNAIEALNIIPGFTKKVPKYEVMRIMNRDV